jgi:hypothetical protein
LFSAPQSSEATPPRWREVKTVIGTKNPAFNIRNNATGAKTGTMREVTAICRAIATRIAAWMTTHVTAAPGQAIIHITTKVGQIVILTEGMRVTGITTRFTARMRRRGRTTDLPVI